jgi:PRTRC genetic system protein A
MIQTSIQTNSDWALVNHKVVKELPLPEHSSHLYEYLFAANGTFVRGIRPNLEVLLPVALYQQPLAGLVAIAPYIKLTPDKIPADIVMSMWLRSCTAYPNEILFHIQHSDGFWQLKIPNQVQTPTSCQPLSNQRNSEFANAVIEAHSHASMPAFFSITDDSDEGGFRIYTVLGRVNSEPPEICTRVGLYRHYWNIPSNLIYFLPSFMLDACGVR